MFGWDDAVIAGLMIGSYVYHRYFETPPPPPKPAASLDVPQTDAGAPYSLLYGRCRVKAAVPAYMSPGFAQPGSVGNGAPDSPFVYGVDIHLILGIPFDGSAENCRVLAMWNGEAALLQGSPGLSSLPGDGGVSVGFFVSGVIDVTPAQTAVGNPTLGADTAAIGGFVEFLNGNPSQTIVDSGGTPTTQLGYKMVVRDGVSTSIIPGYRGFMSVFLFRDAGDGETARWVVGTAPSVPAYSFEVQSLPAFFLGPHQTVTPLEGSGTQNDANPIDVIYDILTGTKGKLGLPSSRIDLTSFRAAAATLDSEGHGFSRSFENGAKAGDMISEILRQIDGVIYEDATIGTIKIKLVRNDYTTTALPLITPDNCVELQNFAFGGWTGVPNKVRITYQRRLDDYRDASATAQNMANAVGQDGETREVQLQMPGITTATLAGSIAARELSARSRPLMKCRAIVNRTFYATNPGDVVRISWPEWGISEIVMRVAAVNLGSLESGKIGLDLIEDYYYVFRHQPPKAGLVTGFTSGGLLR